MVYVKRENKVHSSYEGEQGSELEVKIKLSSCAVPCAVLFGLVFIPLL